MKVRLWMLATVWVISAAVAVAGIVVSYDTDTAGSGSLAPATGFLYQDLDGDGPDDSFVIRAFSDVGGSPWSMGAGYTGPTLFGGVIGQALNNPTRGSFADYGLTGFNLRYQPTGTGESGRLHIAIVFQANDTGLSFGSGSFMRISGHNNGSLPRFENLGSVRWLVRNGTTYYVSNSTITNTTGGRLLDATELASEMWAVYNPTDAFNFNLSLTFDTPTSSLTNMNAFGIITYKDTFTNARHWLSFTEFEVDAIPEPATAGLLFGTGVLGLIRRRLRRG